MLVAVPLIQPDAQRNFTVESHTDASITFSILDSDGEQGFPGDVRSYITYTVTPYTWHLKMLATSLTKKTPIMLSSHVRFPLCCFKTMQPCH